MPLDSFIVIFILNFGGSMAEIRILGGGSWGLAMAHILADNHSVKVWEFNPDFVKDVQINHKNSVLLPEINLSPNIKISNIPSEVIDSDVIDIIIFASPVAYIRETAKRFKTLIDQQKNLKSIINLAKGLEQNTLKRMSEVLQEEIKPEFHDLICTLSGPSHAEEVAKLIPTTVVIAGFDSASIKYAQNQMSTKTFRIYTSYDVVGVEIGGAVKNIISIAAGIIDGLNYGDNTKGALLTRGLTEIKRLGCALGADPHTFSGLSGIGDLITTAISQHSRNRFVGYQLGKMHSLNQILKSMNMVAEGVYTTKAIYQLKNQMNVFMPITDEIYNVLFNNKSPKNALIDLMTRELKDE